MLIQVAAVLLPTEDQSKAGKSETLVVDYTSVTANNKDAAIARFAVQNSDKLKALTPDDLGRLSIVTR